MKLAAHGIAATLPAGWEGAIRGNATGGLSAYGIASAPPALPVAHLASFALPTDRGDFGSGAVDVMRDDDVFVALVEYGTDSVGTPLFARRGLPRQLDAARFARRSLQRQLPKQVGLQVFCTERGRAFCLYVVLQGRDRAAPVAQVNHVLATIDIEEARR